jgi:hypothetical protein
VPKSADAGATDLRLAGDASTPKKKAPDIEIGRQSRNEGQ